MNHSWEPPSNWLKITTLEAHTAGEPLRIVIDGFPPIAGNSILEKRRYVSENYDHLRQALMWEPRGHADMYGCLLTEPETEDGTLGVIFLHNLGYSSMCGHGIIGLSTAAWETGLRGVDRTRTELLIDAPAGRVTARALREGSRLTGVSFLNVPSFVFSFDQTIHVPGLGSVRYDIAYGGAFYAFVQARDFGFQLVPEEFSALVDTGRRIKTTIKENVDIRHPFKEDLGFLYGTIFIGPPQDAAHHSRNVCVFADGEVDRSPTGTGVSARAALHFARGEISKDEPFVVESLLGTCFTGRVAGTTEFGGFDAVFPEVTGSASLVGRCEWWIDPDDPLRHGFFLR
jgi:proline racemase